MNGRLIGGGVPSILSSLLNHTHNTHGGGVFLGAVRWASKKAAGGGNRNSKRAQGNFHGVNLGDGSRAYPNDILVHKQSRLWFHPGLNVRLAGRLNLVSRKVGTVRVTCETPDLNWEEPRVLKYYEGRKGQTFFKKYFHVIPDPQHTRFKCIKTV